MDEAAKPAPHDLGRVLVLLKGANMLERIRLLQVGDVRVELSATAEKPPADLTEKELQEQDDERTRVLLAASEGY